MYLLTKVMYLLTKVMYLLTFHVSLFISSINCDHLSSQSTSTSFSPLSFVIDYSLKMADRCEFTVSCPRHVRWFFRGTRDIAAIDVPGSGEDAAVCIQSLPYHVAYRVTAPDDQFGTGTIYKGKIFYRQDAYADDEAPEYSISNGILHFYGPRNALGSSAHYTYKTIFGGTTASGSYTEVHCTEDEDCIVYKIAVPGIADGTMPDVQAFEEAVVFAVREPEYQGRSAAYAEDEGRYYSGKINLDSDLYMCELNQCQILNGVLRIVVPKKQ